MELLRTRSLCVRVGCVILYRQSLEYNVSKKTNSNCFRHAYFWLCQNNELSDNDVEPVFEFARHLQNYGCAVPHEMEYITICNDFSYIFLNVHCWNRVQSVKFKCCRKQRWKKGRWIRNPACNSGRRPQDIERS